jgi:hypothetical protein
VPVAPGDFELTMDELRVVARYAMEAAEGALHLFEEERADDPRPRQTPALIDVLRRYPPAPAGRSRVAELMASPDTALRTQR